MGLSMEARRFCRRAFSFSGCRESSLPVFGEGCCCAGGSVTLLSLKSFAKQISYPRALFPDSYCAQAGPSEGASRGVVKRDRLAVAAHGCNTHTQRAAVQAARSRRDRFATPGLLTSAL